MTTERKIILKSGAEFAIRYDSIDPEVMMFISVADEIERLRAEVRQLREAGRAAYVWCHARDPAELNALNKLGEALSSDSQAPSAHDIIAAFLQETGQWVTNDATCAASAQSTWNEAILAAYEVIKAIDDGNAPEYAEAWQAVRELMKDAPPDDDDESTLIEDQLDALLDGMAASEDHRDMIAWLVKSGLKHDLAKRVHAAIAWSHSRHDALLLVQRMCREALPKLNWTACFLDGNAIDLLNRAPLAVDKVLPVEKVEVKS